MASGVLAPRGILERSCDSCIGPVRTERKVTDSLLAVIKDGCEPAVGIAKALVGGEVQHRCGEQRMRESELASASFDHVGVESGSQHRRSVSVKRRSEEPKAGARHQREVRQGIERLDGESLESGAEEVAQAVRDRKRCT